MTRLRIVPLAISLVVAWASSACVTSIAAAEPFRVLSATPAPELDGLFTSQPGWTGADGNYSIAVSPTRALWFYSDTWLGEIQNGKRAKPVMINNSVGVLTRADAQAPWKATEFFWGRKDDKPAAFWTPPEGQPGWFWLFAGALDAERLHVFLWQMEKAEGPGGFGFKNAGVWHGQVANPQEPPDRWRLEQQKLPCIEISAERRILYGSAVLRHAGHLYIYGSEERPRDPKFGRRMVVARVAEGQLGDHAAWRFWNGSEWVVDFKQAAPLVPGIAAEYSVTWLPALKQFVAVYHAELLSPKIVARTAPAPWGPWSAESVTLYTCPETTWKKGLFCYSGKAHAWLAGDDELTVTYAANSGNWGDVINDARLYVPRFVRVKVAPPAPPAPPAP